MEPGDLRINARLRDESGVPRYSTGNTYAAANEGNSVLHFRHARPAVIADGRMHHMPPQMSPGAPLVIDRYQYYRYSITNFITYACLHALGSNCKLGHLFFFRNEPVKVWRDPSLMNSGEIRHVVSMQHSGVVQLNPHPHPMVTHGVNTSANLYQQHHDNKPIDTTSRLIPQSTADSLRGRAPSMVYSPHHVPPNNAKPPPENWRGAPNVLQ